MILNVAGTHNKDGKNSAKATDDDWGGKGVHKSKFMGVIALVAFVSGVTTLIIQCDNVSHCNNLHGFIPY